MLSDYFNMTLDELVKDIDVQDVREKNLTDEKIASIYTDLEHGKTTVNKWIKVITYAGIILLAMIIICFVLNILFPGLDFLWVVG